MKIFFSLFVSCICVNAFADVKLPNIFTSNMVLQRDKQLKIWGWADNGEAVAINFNGQTVKTKSGKDGSWLLMLKPMNYGGPFTMTITGKNNISLTNILMGDVWICSGQSNMEFGLRNTRDGAKEVSESKYPSIRLFTVKKATAYKPLKDVTDAGWQECNPETVPDFSAVAYFFARKINTDLNIPIGLIHTSWGGTNIQTWTSWDVMGKEEKYKGVNLDEKDKEDALMKTRQGEFVTSLKNDKGDIEKWYALTASNEGWKNIQQPQSWESSEIGNADGNIWFKKEFELPEAMFGKDGVLNLGPIDDNDVTYFNGIQSGATNNYSAERAYKLSSGQFKKGKNTIVVKVTDTGGGGGFYGKAEQMYIEIDGKRIPLAGTWQYKPSAINTAFGIQDVGPNAFPSQLYNAMIAPITQYAIKGAIWYQGEANTQEAYNYRAMFPKMITDWRKHWNDNFPFFWVQLANFMAPDSIPAQSDWAELREAQSMTLSLPATGQAIITDIGERNDIHPKNKQDVGYRLALVAEKVAYGKDIVYSGPQYQSMKKADNKIIVSFSNAGSGLMLKDRYGYAKGFAVAGEDKKFVWAKAYLDGDKVVVYSDEIKNPVAVRYAWGNNPDDANLYNKEGLPASSFRTDEWKGITQKN